MGAVEPGDDVADGYGMVHVERALGRRERSIEILVVPTGGGQKPGVDGGGGDSKQEERARQHAVMDGGPSEQGSKRHEEQGQGGVEIAGVGLGSEDQQNGG